VAMQFSSLGRVFGGRWLTGMTASLLAVSLGAATAAAQDFAPQPPRARQALKNARELYSRGEYDQAALLYQQVAAQQNMLSPAERADLGVQMKQNADAMKSRQDGVMQIEQAEFFLKSGKINEADSYARYAQANQFLSPTDKQRLASLAQNISKSRGTVTDGDPRTLLTRAREALRRGDIDAAETLARQAEKNRTMMSNLNIFGETPARVLEDCRKARLSNPVPPPAFPGTASETIVPVGATEIAGDPTKAVSNYAPGVRRDQGVPMPAEEVVTPANDPAALLRQGRSLYLQQRYDDAEKLAQAAEMHNRRYGLFEDSPKKLRDDINRARTQLDVDKSAKLTAEARKQLKAGNYAEARNLATQAKQFPSHGTMNWADTPDAVLRDVARLEKSNPQPMAPAGAAVPNMTTPGVAQANNLIPPPNLESAQSKMQAHSRAVALVAEARALETQDQLIEAFGKAMEAQRVETTWGPQEESPGIVLRDLDTKAAARVRALLNQATETVNNTADAARFQKADQCLVLARRLAEAFRQDMAPIDQRVQWLQTAASQGAAPVAAAPVPLQSVPAVGTGLPQAPLDPHAKSEHDTAVMKLDQARLEMKAGNIAIARKLAEDAFGTKSVKTDAEAVLRSIDAEEHAQAILVNTRNFAAGCEAFKQNDYRKAANLLANVDVRMLTPDQARKVGEIIESPQMRGGLQQVAATVPGTPGSVEAPTTNSSLVPPPAPDKNPAPSVPGLTPGGKVTNDLNVDATPEKHLSEVRQMQKIQSDKLRDMSRAAQLRSTELSRAGQHEKAIEVLQDYQVKLKDSGLDEVMTTTLNRPIEERIKSLRSTLAKQEVESEKRRNVENLTFDENGRVAKETKAKEKAAELMKKGVQRYKEGSYDESLALGKQARELDPDSSAVGALIEMSVLAKNKNASDEDRRNRERLFMELLNTDPGRYTPTDSRPLNASPDQIAKNLARKNNSVQEMSKYNTKEAQIERKLSLPITLNFQDVPLYRVLQDLQAMSGVNIVPDTAALAAENISLEQQLSFNVDNISMRSALNLLLKKVNLTYVIKNEVLEITTERQATGKRRMVTYSVADLVVPVEDHPTSPISSFEEALKRHISSTGGGVRYSAPVPFTPNNAIQNGTPVSQQASQGGKDWQTSKSRGNTIEHLVIDLITNTVAPNTWEQAGGEGRIQYFPLGHALVVSQVQEVQEEVQALLNALRKLQDIQVSIEMRIVSVSEKFFEKIGLDFDVNIKTPSYRVENQLQNGSYGTPFNINRNLNVNNVVTGMTPGGQLTPDLNVPIKASSYDFSVPPFGGFPGTLGLDGGLSLGLAFLNDIQVFMFLEAAQGDQRTHIMQAPKLTVFNGQTANIDVQDQMFFLTGVSVAQAGSQTFFVPQNQPFPVGVGMQVTPVVSADRRFVRLNLVPQISNLISANIPLIPVQVPIPQLFDAPNGQGFISGQPVIFQMFFQQPSFTTINLNTTVNVPDGGTVLLGGLKTMAEGRNEFGPPILSKIPYISRLFRNTAFGREAQSIMIMVTPRIIINEEIEREILGEATPIPRQ
jgi:type II secretory pathway component GspD/PulD (secretin)